MSIYTEYHKPHSWMRYHISCKSGGLWAGTDSLAAARLELVEARDDMPEHPWEIVDTGQDIPGKVYQYQR